MKRIVSVFSICLAVSTGFAQPTITSSTSPQIGDVATGTLADTTGWNPGTAGANVTWNFTTLTATGTGSVT